MCFIFQSMCHLFAEYSFRLTILLYVLQCVFLDIIYLLQARIPQYHIQPPEEYSGMYGTYGLEFFGRNQLLFLCKPIICVSAIWDNTFGLQNSSTAEKHKWFRKFGVTSIYYFGDKTVWSWGFMTTSWHGNAFRITSPLWGEFTGH